MSNDIDENEQPSPLHFNIITNKNLEREKSKKYTKKLLNILKKRSCKINFDNVTIKKEVVEVKEEVTVVEETNAEKQLKRKKSK